MSIATTCTCGFNTFCDGRPECNNKPDLYKRKEPQVVYKMTEDQWYLLTASEECNETAQRISKALRFGINEVQKGQDLSNSERIVYEFNDLYAMMEILQERGLIDKIIDREAIDLKKAKVVKFLELARSEGVV